MFSSQLYYCILILDFLLTYHPILNIYTHLKSQHLHAYISNLISWTPYILCVKFWIQPSYKDNNTLFNILTFFFSLERAIVEDKERQRAIRAIREMAEHVREKEEEVSVRERRDLTQQSLGAISRILGRFQVLHQSRNNIFP